MINLLINVDHVATLRNARQESFPDPVHAAALCELAGADGIVFHLREDRRHITERDARLLSQTVKGRLDFELSTDAGVVSICSTIKPDLATLVPERRDEVTTEGGLDVRGNKSHLAEVVTHLQEEGIEVSLFVDPDPEQIETAAHVNADAVELHTGEYANASDRESRDQTLRALRSAARAADEADLRIHAGHGLDYNNFSLFKERVPHVQEVSIGFAVVSRALLSGMEKAVEDMRAVVGGSV